MQQIKTGHWHKWVKGMWKDKMVQATFWFNLLYSASFPSVHIWLMREVTEKMLSFNSMFVCVATIVFNIVWNKYSDKLYKFFPALCIVETGIYTILHIMAILGIVSSSVYYVIDTMVIALVTRNMICGGNKLRSIAYTNNRREKYDNTIMIANSIATLLGGFVALISYMQIHVALIVLQVALVVDNIFYILAYYDMKRK